MSLLTSFERRCLIVTGKGGVGKTTVAAALAQAFSRRNKRVLLAEIVTSDETPSQLQQALGGPLVGDEPQRVSNNLWATLLTPSRGHLRFLQDVLPLKILADAAMKSQGLRRFLLAAPGFSDMGIMYRVVDLAQQTHPDGRPLFEVLIIDAPATGHALALAQIPEFLARVIPGGPILRAARAGVSFLTDPMKTGCVVVTVPETLPLTEAIELQNGLKKLRLPVCSLIINRIPVDPFTAEERSWLHAQLPTSVYGARELKRLERAHAALHAFRGQHDNATVNLPEVDRVGPEVSQLLARSLAQEA